MEALLLLVVFIIVTVAVVSRLTPAEKTRSKTSTTGRQFYYSRKSSVVTARELNFYRRLESVVEGRYYVFPQMHLSAMMINKTSGRYRRLAFQRINRTSVDYVLCDKTTLEPVYAVELDDRTHDTGKRRARDTGVEQMLGSVGIPLVRFRNAESMTDDQIAEAFQKAADGAR